MATRFIELTRGVWESIVVNANGWLVGTNEAMCDAVHRLYRTLLHGRAGEFVAALGLGFKLVEGGGEGGEHLIGVGDIGEPFAQGCFVLACQDRRGESVFVG